MIGAGCAVHRVTGCSVQEQHAADRAVGKHAHARSKQVAVHFLVSVPRRPRVGRGSLLRRAWLVGGRTPLACVLWLWPLLRLGGGGGQRLLCQACVCRRRVSGRTRNPHRCTICIAVGVGPCQNRLLHALHGIFRKSPARRPGRRSQRSMQRERMRRARRRGQENS